MTDIEISEPHGYLLDSDGKVVQRFANWSVGYHAVPDVVESVEYVDGPADHDRSVHEDYRTKL